MATETPTADSEGRITLPLEFANATLVIEQLSPNELRLRMADALLDHPPGPIEALRRALRDESWRGVLNRL